MRSAAALLLAAALASLPLLAAARPSPATPARIAVDPSADSSLATAADRVRQTLEAGSRDILVELLPGHHRVPAGGLQLGREHSPAPEHRVLWRAAQGGGPVSVHGGEAIAGWAPAADASLPAGVLAAPVPTALRGRRLRHLYVRGVRASRTRVPAGYLNLTLATTTLAEPEPAAAAGTASCNLSGAWRVGGHNHWASVTETAGGDFTAVGHGVPRGGWASAAGTVYPNGTLAAAFSNGHGHDTGTVSVDCGRVVWGDSRHHPAWSRAPTPSPRPPGPPPPPPLDVHGGYRSNSSEPLSWANPGDVELVYSGVASNWAESRCTVSSVSAPKGGAGGGSQVAVKSPCFWNLVHAPWHPIGALPPAFVENVRAHLKEPGTWYYDLAKAEVLYMPRAGETADTLDAMLAVEETLVHHNGSSGHVWQGVTFQYATWLRPMESAGFVEGQSAACSVCPAGLLKAHYIANGQFVNNGPFPTGCGGGDVYETTPGNVLITNSKNLSFENCTFQRLGASAASAGGGSQRISWSGCTFRDVSAGALMLGGLDTCSETNVSLWDSGFSVSDSTITNMPGR